MCWPVIGGLVAGAGALMGARNAAAGYEAEQAGLRTQEANERAQTSYEMMRARDEAARVQGRARAGFAASGIDPSFGSAADVITESEIESRLDLGAIRWSGNARAANTRYRGQIAGMNASAARAAAPLAFAAPVIEGVAQYQSSFQ